MDDYAGEDPVSPDIFIWYQKVKGILSSGGIVEFRPKGFSMWPVLRPGSDTVYLRSATRYRRSDIVLALCRDPHGVFLHRISAVSSGEITLMGDANLRQTEKCVPECIAGKVVAIKRNGRDVAALPPAKLIACIQLLPGILRRSMVRILNRWHTNTI